MATTEIPKSSWLASLSYQRGTLRITKRDGEAMVFMGVPPWVPGLLLAHHSTGRAFNLLVKAKGYEYRKEEAAQVGPEPNLEALLRASLVAHR